MYAVTWAGLCCGEILRQTAELAIRPRDDNIHGRYGECGFRFNRMNATAISATDAAKDFLRLLELVEDRGESAVILREGRPIATLSPMPRVAMTCTELAERWPQMERLSPDEANAFADDLENARATLPPLKPAWD
jgi:antitoxin (DNA-binding transcriptional repressor) of toxin-antitoxin stability system